MKRRSFISGIAAEFGSMAVCPTFVWRSMPKPINFDLFTDAECIRYSLATPWSIGDSVVATDGRVMIRVPGDHEAATDIGRVPDVSKMQWDAFDSAGWSDIESGLQFAKDKSGDCPCIACMGTGRVGDPSTIRRELSRDIDGDPVWQFTGGQKCDECDGEGCLLLGPLYTFAGARFGGEYIERLKMIGTTDAKLVDYVRPDLNSMVDPYPTQILLFRFGDNGRGFLMPRIWFGEDGQ